MTQMMGRFKEGVCFNVLCPTQLQICLIPVHSFLVLVCLLHIIIKFILCSFTLMVAIRIGKCLRKNDRCQWHVVKFTKFITKKITCSRCTHQKFINWHSRILFSELMSFWGHFLKFRATFFTKYLIIMC